MTRVVVVSAGMGSPSTTKLLADRIAAAAADALGRLGRSAEVEHIELRRLATPLAATITTGGIVGPEVAAAHASVDRADALIVVTPVFSASYSGLFKLFFDTLDTDALNGVPTIIAATAGTPRHSLVLDFHLRPLFAYLRAVIVPTGVFAATEDFGTAASAALSDRITRAADELACVVVGQRAGALPASEPARTARRKPLGESTEVTPFEELLRGHLGNFGSNQS